MDDLLFRDEVFAIIGAAIDVHRELGAGFLEAVYQEALEHELSARGVPFIAQKELPVHYKGQQLSRRYICDLLCFDQILVELKAMDSLTSREQAQVLNYLKASRVALGLLVNFGASPKLEWRRLVRTQ